MGVIHFPYLLVKLTLLHIKIINNIFHIERYLRNLPCYPVVLTVCILQQIILYIYHN